jgi:hypothetical protein
MKTALVAIALLASAQDKVKLEVRAQKGEKYTRSSKSSSTGDLTLEVAGQSIPQSVSEKETKTFKDEVLEVEGALPTKIRRSFAEWTQSKVPPGAVEPQESKKGLHGKTIVLKRIGDRTEYEGADGVSPSELGQNRIRPESILADLPREPVAPGATWKLDEKKILEEFRESADEESPAELTAARGTGRFERVETHKGQKCAVLLLELESDGGLRGQKDVKLTLKMATTVWLALDSGRPLTMKGTGSVDVSGKIDMDGNVIKIDGNFKLQQEGEQTYE